MNSAGKVSVVDADGPTEEEQQVRRVPKRLRDELNGIVPGFGDELGRYLRNIGGSVDDEKSRERKRAALMALMDGPATLAGIKVKSLNTNSTLGSAGAIMQAAETAKKKEGYLPYPVHE